MKQIDLPCGKCGAVTAYDPNRPVDRCAACGEKLTVDVSLLTDAIRGDRKEPGRIRRALSKPALQGEPIPVLPTSSEKKPTSFYVKQALMWGGATVGLIGLLMLLYGAAAALAK